MVRTLLFPTVSLQQLCCAFLYMQVLAFASSEMSLGLCVMLSVIHVAANSMVLDEAAMHDITGHKLAFCLACF